MEDDQSQNAGSRFVTWVLLLLAAFTFLAPTIAGMSIAFGIEVFDQNPARFLLPVLGGGPDAGFGFVRELWTGLPALVAGVAYANGKYRRLAFRMVAIVMTFVAIAGSLVQVFQPDAAALRQIAAGLAEADLAQTHASLVTLFDQVEQTREIAIPFLIGILGLGGSKVAQNQLEKRGKS